jgi:hypothetical protein
MFWIQWRESMSMRPLLYLMMVVLLPLVARADQIIRPGELWRDHRGQPIQAHGGGMLRLGKTFYWFGEDRSPTNDPQKRFVSCYSSDDLVHWQFRNQVLKLADPEGWGEGWVLERPKVFHNTRTKKFVLYAHLDDRRYQAARVLVAVSDTVDGDYHFVKSFRPLDRESRDIGQFVDDDGTAYLVFESRPTRGFFIARLSDDFLSVEQQMSLVDAPLEGGAIVHYGDLYYAIGSHLTGWRPNPNVYATARSLRGPWSAFHDIAPPESNTYGSQSTMLLKVQGTKATTVIYMGDIWKPKALFDSRYLWMPVTIGGGQLRLPSPRNWKINVKTGQSKILP